MMNRCRLSPQAMQLHCNDRPSSQLDISPLTVRSRTLAAGSNFSSSETIFGRLFASISSDTENSRKNYS